MTIETKYNIGDVVWFSSLGFAKSAKICHIIINVFIDGDTSIEYGLENRGYYWKRNEHEISQPKKNY